MSGQSCVLMPAKVTWLRGEREKEERVGGKESVKGESRVYITVDGLDFIYTLYIVFGGVYMIVLSEDI